MNTFKFLLPLFFIVWGPVSALCEQEKDAPVAQHIVLQGEGIEMEAFLYLPRGKGPFPAAIVLPGGGRPETIGMVGPHDWRIRERRFPVKIDRQPVEYCADVSCPVLVLHGGRDTVTEVQQGKHLHETLKALNKDAKLVIYEGAAHGFTYKGHNTRRISCNADITAESLVEVETFITGNLRKSPSTESPPASPSSVGEGQA